jgi:hypothetical protein
VFDCSSGNSGTAKQPVANARDGSKPAVAQQPATPSQLPPLTIRNCRALKRSFAAHGKLNGCRPTGDAETFPSETEIESGDDSYFELKRRLQVTHDRFSLMDDF